MRRKIKLYFLAIALPLLVGILAGWLSRNGIGGLDSLNKPPLMPAQWVFPVVWTILYGIMGYTSAVVYDSYAKEREQGLIWYMIQLGMNFCWSMVFFILNWWLFAAIWLFVMILVIFAMNFNFYTVDKKLGWLNVPYLLWCFVALYLNIGIYLLN